MKIKLMKKQERNATDFLSPSPSLSLFAEGLSIQKVLDFRMYTLLNPKFNPSAEEKQRKPWSGFTHKHLSSVKTHKCDQGSGRIY